MTRIALTALSLVSALAVTVWLYSHLAATPDRTAAAGRTQAPPNAPAAPAGGGARATSPTLYCQFYVFVESQPFVAFLFEPVAAEPAAFAQIYVAKANGERTDFDGAGAPRPRWALDRSGDPARLSGRVTVPAASQSGTAEEEIAIELHGFDPAAAGGRWSEASLKSVYYQNLPGKCRLDGA